MSRRHRPDNGLCPKVWLVAKLARDVSGARGAARPGQTGIWRSTQGARRLGPLLSVQRPWQCIFTMPKVSAHTPPTRWVHLEHARHGPGPAHAHLSRSRHCELALPCPARLAQEVRARFRAPRPHFGHRVAIEHGSGRWHSPAAPGVDLSYSFTAACRAAHLIELLSGGNRQRQRAGAASQSLDVAVHAEDVPRPSGPR